MKARKEQGKDETQVLIEAAITAAVEASMRGIDEKIAAAVNLGVSIGAATGAEIGAQAAVRAAERERKRFKKQQYDWKFQNTKLLLRNYRRLNDYYKNAVFDTAGAEEADAGFEDILRSMNGKLVDEEIVVESIQRNFTATKIIMTHVNKMLDCYKILCERSNRPDDARHWRVLDGLYLTGEYTTAEEIAKREYIDKRTVYRDIDICVADLTVLFFGVGGIQDL